MKTGSQLFLAWADVVRIVAIFLVVLLHTFKVSTPNSLEGRVSLYIVTFATIAVPLFIMLTGSLLLPKIETWQAFFLKRVRRIVMPWVTWTVVVFTLFHVQNAPTFSSAVSQLIDTFTASFTYLPLIFCLYLLIPTFRVVVRHSSYAYVVYLMILWFLAISLLPFVRNSMAFPLSVDNGLVTQTIRFCGYLLAGWLLSQVIITKKTTFLFLASALLGLIFWTTIRVQKGDVIDFTYSSYTSPWVVVSSMIAFVLLINAVPSFEKMSPTAQKSIRLLSKASFGVFLIHNAVITVVRPFIQSLHLTQLAQNIIFWLTVSLICFGSIMLLYRIKPIRQFVT